ncbi:MAG: hypothetical protein B7Y50_03285 [Hydrogenophilales bacterium 28-61-11]|nr:MAG: hypothetical protein B7Y50_03285 [Hydrogenophilales bacterium 28-61-11]OYZ57248.1 MAG: hypothetical protein B7Y21_08210 [Hydrogenophilales bacterium 16-61-112]
MSGLAGVLLTCQPAAAQRAPASARAACTSPVAPVAAVPDAYLFYHALASHPGLYEPRTHSVPCPSSKRIRT